MRMRTLALLFIGTATAAAAQAPGPPPGGPTPNRPSMGGEMGPGPMGPPQMGMSPPAAKMLLANSAELDLTDAQIMKLAGIARRAEARRRATRAAMDSAGMRFRQPGDSLARHQFGERMRADMEKMRDQMKTDQRDAIATLTADQQAKAWEMISNRGMRARGRMGAQDRMPMHGHMPMGGGARHRRGRE